MDSIWIIWLAHWFATVYMTGLIWFVQLVHYPLMDRARHGDYVEFQRQHMWRTTVVVGPAMLVELISGITLLFMRPEFISFTWALINLIALMLIWVSSATLQVPSHRKLEKGFRADAHQLLVRSNWIRTVLWTARGLACAWVMM